MAKLPKQEKVTPKPKKRPQRKTPKRRMEISEEDFEKLRVRQ